MADGSVTKYTAKDGRVTWRWRIALPDPMTGKRSWSQWTFRTRKELEAFKTQKLAEMGRGQSIGRSTKTVAALLEDWRTLEADHSDLSVTSRHNYALSIRRYLVPGLGAIPVQTLTTEQIERHYATLLAQGYARATLAVAHICLRGALDRAVRHGLVSRNVAAVRLRVLSARNPQAKARRGMHTWTREECAAFLAVSPQSHYGPLWALLLGTGLRRGEGLAVRWGDLTLPEAPGVLGQVRVAQSIEPLPRGPAVVLPPKNRKTRLVPLVPSLVAALRAHRPHVEAHRAALGDAWEERDLVFPRAATGGHISPRVVASDLDRLIAQAGVPRLTIHELRHTWATLTIQAGIPIHVVSRWLGHASVSITMNIYAHVTDALEKQGADILVDLFSSPAPGPAGPPLGPTVRTACAWCPYAPPSADQRPEIAPPERPSRS